MKPTLSTQEIIKINQQFIFTEKSRSKKKAKTRSKLTKVEEGKMGIYIQLNEQALQKKNLHQTYLQVITRWKKFLPLLEECDDYEIEICID